MSAPILILSVRANEADKIVALDEGADDYLTKPFSAGELLARIRALLRRAAELTSPPPVITSGELEIDIARRRVKRAGEEIALTPTEFDILAFLARNAGFVVTQRMILEHVWGPEWVEDAQTLRVHVSNLRKKIEPRPGGPRYIITEPGWASGSPPRSPSTTDRLGHLGAERRSPYPWRSLQLQRLCELFSRRRRASPRLKSLAGTLRYRTGRQPGVGTSRRR